MKRHQKPKKKHTPLTDEARKQMAERIQNTLHSRCTEEVPASEATSRGRNLFMSLLKMESGTASASDFNDLSAAANMSIVLCEKGIGSEHLAVCIQASTDLAICRDEYGDTGVFKISQKAAESLREMIDIREAQLKAEGYTAGLEYQAASIVVDRINRGCVVRVARDEVAA